MSKSTSASSPKSASNSVSKPKQRRLTKAERAEILRRLATGEVQRTIAEDYGVTRAAISLIKVTHENPDRVRRNTVYKKRLMPEEAENMRKLLLSTEPKDHGVSNIGNADKQLWTIKRAQALATKLYKKSPSVRQLNECAPELRLSANG